MDSVESVDLLGPGIVKVLGNLNISEIDLQKEVKNNASNTVIFNALQQ
jgi:hypothetical protein